MMLSTVALHATDSKLRAGLLISSLLLAALLLLGCGGGGGESSEPRIQTGPLRISDRGIKSYREHDADNSIEEYGREASRAELEQAATTVHEYLVARVSKDWVGACSLSSAFLRRHIYELMKPRKPTTCAKLFKELAPGEPPIAGTTREATEVDADSLRVDGDTGFLFFNAKTDGHKLIVVRDGGAWKPAGLLPTPLH